jgi:hypothetical protein
MEPFNLQQFRQQLFQQIQQRGVPEREVFKLSYILGEQALDKRKSKGLSGGNNAYSRGILNNDFIDNVRCRNLFTNNITFINSSNSVNFGAGGLIEQTSNQGFFAVAIGNKAGESNQGDYAIAIGTEAGRFTQGDDAIAIGSNAGLSLQSENAIAIGANTGVFNQSSQSIAIGSNAGYYLQQNNAIAIGSYAGNSFQGNACVAIGSESGFNNQGKTELNQGGICVAIGYKSGRDLQGEFATSVGRESALFDANLGSVCIGLRAGAIDSSAQSVSIGCGAGEYNQSRFNVSIGKQSGNYNQGPLNHCIGYQSGFTNQSFICDSIGYQAGCIDQRFSTAIGYQAGLDNQGGFAGGVGVAIAIGNQAGITNQHEYSTVINATSTPLNTTSSNSLFINPIREINSGSTVGMLHNEPTLNNEIIFYDNAAKTFVIQHPLYNDKFLSHACIEGPTADVFYRGTGEIIQTFSEIVLPDFAEKFLKDFNFQVSSIVDSNDTFSFSDEYYSVEETDDKNVFKVFGPPGKFNWIVHVTREEFEVEPFKHNIIVKGDGPYTYQSNE